MSLASPFRRLVIVACFALATYFYFCENQANADEQTDFFTKVGELSQKGQITDAIAALGRGIEQASTNGQKIERSIILGDFCVNNLVVECVPTVSNILLGLIDNAEQDDLTDKQISLARTWFLYFAFQQQLWNGDFSWLDQSFSMSLGKSLRLGTISQQLYIKAQIQRALGLRLRGKIWESQKIAARAFGVGVETLRADPNGFADLLMGLIKIAQINGDTLKASRYYFAADAFISSGSRNNAEFALYRNITANILIDNNDFDAAIEHAKEGIRILENIQFDVAARPFMLADLYDLLTGLYFIANRISDAQEALTQHPLGSQKTDVISQGRFKNKHQFTFAIMDILVSAKTEEGADTSWLPLFQQRLDFQLPAEVSEVLETYRQFALAVLTAGTDKESARKIAIRAASRSIDRFTKTLSASPTSFPFLNVVDRIIVGFGLEAAQVNIEANVNLILQASELLNRAHHYARSDALTIISKQPPGPLRNKTRAALRSLAQHSIWEIKKINELVSGVLPKKTERFSPSLVDKFLSEFDSIVQRDEDAFAVRAKPATVSELQENLSIDEAFVTHFLSPGFFVRVCVSQKNFRVVYEPWNPDKAQRAIDDIRILQLALTATHPPSLKLDSQYPVSSAIRLQKLILGELDGCVKPGETIVYAPNISLIGLPLQALLSERPPEVPGGFDLSQAEWVGIQNPLTYVTSARSFISARTLAETQQTGRGFIGIGNPNLRAQTDQKLPDAAALLASRAITTRGGSVANLVDLPDTELELKNISQNFTEQSLLLGTDASEDNVRRQMLSQYAVIDFATHGLIKNDLEGLQEAALVLAPTVAGYTDELNDGLITASELANLDINARLVILSACNTANFDLDLFGAEVQGLAAALAFSGVPATVVSLWPVETRTSRFLMERMVSNLHADTSLSVAHSLSNAVKSAIREAPSKAFSHPRFWAPFIVLGDGGIRLEPDDTDETQKIIFHPQPEDPGSFDRIVPMNEDRWLVRTTKLASPEQDVVSNFIQVRDNNGSLVWEQRTAMFGSESLAISGEEILAGTYAWDSTAQAATAFVEVFERDGKPISALKVRPEDEHEMINDVIYHSDGGIIAATVPWISDLTDPKFEQNASVNITEMSLPGPIKQKIRIDFEYPQINTEKVKVIESGDSLYVFVSKRASDVSVSYPDSGLVLPCWSGLKTYVVILDRQTFSITDKFEIDDFLFVDLYLEDSNLYLAGSFSDPCGDDRHAALIKISDAVDSRFEEIWSAEVGIESWATAVTTSLKGLIVAGVSLRGLGLRTSIGGNQNDTATMVNRPIVGSQSSLKLESFLVEIAESGEALKREFSFGLSFWITDIASTEKSVHLVGNLGGRPIWATLNLAQTGKNR